MALSKMWDGGFDDICKEAVYCLCGDGGTRGLLQERRVEWPNLREDPCVTCDMNWIAEELVEMALFIWISCG